MTDGFSREERPPLILSVGARPVMSVSQPNERQILRSGSLPTYQRIVMLPH